MATAVHPIPGARAPYERVSGSWARLATSVLDLLRDAVFVLGRDARLLGMNRAARSLLRERDGLALISGEVMAATPSTTVALRHAVERAALGERGRLEVPRNGRGPLALVVEPSPVDASGAAAVVFAVDHEARDLRTEALMARYRFTRTQCSIAQRLASGTGLDSIARDLDISMHTVRGHLKQIFEKTRTHRQAQLVSKLLSEA